MDGKNLSRNESRVVMKEIMEDKATDAQISAYLVALRMKGETVDEITGSAEALTDKTKSIKLNYDDIVDMCGTGCDNLHTFNISTTAAFVTAGAGITVAKHGHRSVSSVCGSADLLMKIGININMSNTKISRCLKEVGLAFIFASKNQKLWEYVLGPRREIGARTIFNVLSTLTNPARIKRQVIGVYDPTLMHTLIDVMRELGAKHIMVVHGEDGLDEITISGKTRVLELIDKQVYEYEITPEDFKLTTTPISEIKSDSCEENIRYFNQILAGKSGPATDIVLLNAGAAIKVSGKVESLYEGIELAKESIKSGAAKQKLDKLIKFQSR
jgi:anthranilate phosphoribosyltransferase